MFITNQTGDPVNVFYQPTFSLELTAPQADLLHAWHFPTDGGGGGIDPHGVYREQITPSYSRTLRTDPNATNGKIPLVVLDSGGRQGLYVGTEWSLGDIKIVGSASNPQGATVQSTTPTFGDPMPQAARSWPPTIGRLRASMIWSMDSNEKCRGSNGKTALAAAGSRTTAP